MSDKIEVDVEEFGALLLLEEIARKPPQYTTDGALVWLNEVKGALAEIDAVRKKMENKA